MDAEFLPGTERLFGEDCRQSQSSDGLKKHGDIVLHPQPSDSPNDPLLWSLPRKYWHSFLVCFITALTAATANDAGSAQDGMNTELGISWAAMNTAVGVLFIGIGYWTLLMSPAAWLYGRRITYLTCILLGFIGAIWMAKTKTAQDSIWNQLFVGASEACAEANVQLSLSDIFHQHQRGTVLGIYVLATSIGTYLGPLIAGYIADSNLGWRWIGWWSVIISGVTFVVFYFTLEETAFDRCLYAGEPVFTNEVNGAISNDKTAANTEKENADDKQKSGDSINALDSSAMEANGLNEKRKSYLQRIALITPAHNLRGTGFKQYIGTLFYTLRIFTFPAVLYSGLQWGAQDAFLTFYLTVEEENWIGPPWNYSDSADGIMNVPCLIGAVIGCFYGGVLSDYFVLWAAKRNGGIKEAEHRLWFMFLAGIIGPIGKLLFGIGTANSWSWLIPYLGLGFTGFTWGTVGDLSMAYLMDCYSDMVLEGMVGVSVINNTIACIFSFVAQDWLDTQGVKMTFIQIAMLEFVFIVLATVPMMYWGKTWRRKTRASYEKFLAIRYREIGLQ